MDVLYSENLREAAQSVDRQEAFTVAEAARIFFNRSAMWGYRRVYAGDLKVMRDGGRLMVTRDEINKMLRRQVVHVPRARRKNQKNAATK